MTTCKILRWLIRSVVALSAVLSLMLAPAPHPAPAASGMPPQILGWTPGVVRDLPLDAPITVYFNRSMDQASLVRAWHLSPATAGRFSWGATSLTFRPDHLFRAGSYYHLTIGTEARDRQGDALATPFSLAFSAGASFHVTGFTPARNTGSVPLNSLIAVSFSQPVVALAGPESGPAAPPGWHLSISPRTPGHGSWLGTSTWVFHPDSGLIPSSRYVVSLSPSVRDQWGDTLGRALRWTFHTITPEIVARSPTSTTRFAAPSSTIKVTFNQPMAHRSVLRALAVRSGSAAVSGAVSWQGDTMLFRPRRPLAAGQWYRVTVSSAARSANQQGSLARPMSWTFRVAPLPRIAWTDPGNGQINFGSSVSLHFTAPVDWKTLNRHLSITPRPSSIDTGSYGTGNVSAPIVYSINANFNPSTTYAVTITPGARDLYGRPLPGGYSFRFKTARTEPSVALYGMPQDCDAIGYSAGRVVDAPIQFINIPRVHYTLLRTSPDEVDSQCGALFPAGKTVRSWSQAVPHPLNSVQNLGIPLTRKDGSPLAAGLYYLDAEAPMNIPGARPWWTGPPGSSELIYVSNVSLTVKHAANETLVWVTSAATGKPLSGVTVTLFDYQMNQLASGKTAADGLYIVHNSFNGNDVTAVVSDATHFGMARPFWSPSVTFPNPTGVLNSLPCCYPYGPSPNGTYGYTDRPVYRPGQTVHFRAVLWKDSDGVYSHLGPRMVTANANDDMGHRLYRARLRLDRFGAVSGSFRLPSRAATGDTQIYVGLTGGQGPGVSIPFSIAEYRKPEFLTTVTTNRTDYVQKEMIDTTIGVRYLFGTPVRGQRVAWMACAQPLFIQPNGWDTYSFFDWESYWNLPFLPPRPQAQQCAFGRLLRRGSGTTDARGRMAIHVPVDISRDRLDQTVTIEATTTDINHQPVSGRVQVQAHKAAFAIGLAAADELLPAGHTATVHVAAVRSDGSPVPNQPLTAKIYRRTYSSKLVNDGSGAPVWRQIPKDTLVETRSIMTNSAGKAEVSFVAGKGGEYVVKVQGKDQLGNTARISLSIYASAEGFSDFGLSNDTTITLKPDKDSYRVGDTAHILVASPFADASALVTLERNNIRLTRVQHLASNSSTIDIPITLTDLPNVYVTVTLYRGWRGSSPPDWRYGAAELHVQLDPKHLRVRLAQSRKRYHPGDPVTYTVTTTDSRGRPVSAQVSLALVDTAVLALKDESNADILQALYADRPLGVSTSSSGVISIDRLSSQPDFKVQPVGGQAAHRAANGAGLAQAPAKAGGGGGGEASALYIRSNFADTANWSSHLVTNSSGRATIRLRLPDNTTTWRLDARAVGMNEGVGQAQLHSLATRDMILRPATPRFLLQGDHLQLGTVLNDTLNRPVSARVSLTASGLTVAPAGSRTVSLPAHGERLLLWNAAVPESKAARLTFRAISATAGVQGDAVRIALPVHPPLTDETVATAGQVYDAARQMVIVPSGAVSAPGALTVQVSSSITAGLGAAFGELRPSPYESNENIADRLLAAAALRSLPQSITGLSLKTYARLPRVINVAVLKLQAYQYYDGSWGWFYDPYYQIGDPLVTADVVRALTAAGHHGNAVTRGRQYLRQWLASPPTPRPPLDERTQVLMELAQSGAPDGQDGETLYDNTINRARLDTTGLAELGLAIARVNAGLGRSLASVLDSRAVVSATGAHWEDSAQTGWWSAPPIATTITALNTLLTLSPHDAFVPAAARWLMLTRQGSGWDCSHDTAEAIAALATYARAAGEGKAAYSYRVTVNAAGALAGSYGPGNQRVSSTAHIPISRLYRAGPNAVVIGRQAADGTLGAGPLYYVTRLHYYLPAQRIAPRSAGIDVSRTYLTLQGKAIGAASAGTVVRVRLRIHTAHYLSYLHVDDPIPAGLEPIDESLNTSRQAIPQPGPFSQNGTPNLYWYLTHTDLRDDRVTLYATWLPPGTYTYSYLAQATVSGHYTVAPTHAFETFFPEVFGRSVGSMFVVR